MADDDNFEIDIYGDDAVDTSDYQQDHQIRTDIKDEEKPGISQLDGVYDDINMEDGIQAQIVKQEDGTDIKRENDDEQNYSSTHDVRQYIGTTQGPATNDAHITRQAPVQQGVKRQEGPDNREVDPGASSALVVSELNWWTTDDDIRGWANQCDCEDELKEITFSEHKVNGKSKGQAYLEFASPQAATAVKQKIDKFSEGQPAARKHIVSFSSPATNPFKATPKDNRGSQNGSVAGGVSSNYESGRGGRGGYNNNGSFRGRGGMGGRGNLNNMNRNFGGVPSMNGMAGGFQNPMAGGFAGAMGAMGGGVMAGFNNFNQAGMMMGGMRGGRGGFNNFNRGGMMGMGGMGGLPMGGMPMGGNMGMPMMGGMPGGGFGGNAQGHFNPAFLQAQQMGSAGGDQWNPHGNKRMRPE